MNKIEKCAIVGGIVGIGGTVFLGMMGDSGKIPNGENLSLIPAITVGTLSAVDFGYQCIKNGNGHLKKVAENFCNRKEIFIRNFYRDVY